MQRTFLILLVFFAGLGTLRSQTPYTWTFSAKKVYDRTYEIHCTVNVNAPWHTYSQFTPSGGPVPTRFTFAKNPLCTTDGPVKEIGEMHVRHEAVFGVDVKYFDGQADFVQRIKVKGTAKTNFTGTVQFMVCNDQQCLPPTTQKFTVALN
jgi:Disulphide bond corrector protein DsbC